MATKKILTDLNTDSKIGFGKEPAYFVDIDNTSTANDETRGINVELSKENTSGAGFASNVYGIKAHSVANSSEIVVNIGGVWNKAEHTGSGQTYYITGGTNRGYHSGSGNSSAISGTFSEGLVGGTGSGDHSYVVGVNSVAKLDNPNATVDFLQGQHCTIKLNDGEVTDNAMALILDLDHTGGTISGDFEYLRIQNDTFDSTVGGTSRAINSLSTLPSEFGGSIQAPTFYLGSTASYIRHNAGDTELFADSSLSIESGDGMLIEISDVIDISGGGDITSDSAFTAQSLIKAGGTSSQFLKADGSVDSSTYLTSGDLSSYLPLSGGTLTGDLSVPHKIIHAGDTNTFLLMEDDRIQLKAGGRSVIEMDEGTDPDKVKLGDSTTITYTLGDFGIGTFSPDEKLEVDGNIKATSFIKDGGASTEFLKADGSVDTNTYLTSADVTDSQWDDVTGGINYASGNVGIGTTSPQEKLDISAGDIRLDDQYSINWATDDANIGRVRITGNETPDTFLIATDNQERLRVNNSGVGIGTNDPQAKLDVNGGIRMGNDTTTASADNEGTMRYYTDDYASYVDICMATLDSGYSGSDYHWINIVRNIFPA